MFFSLAWRNIWRNRRRSAITISAICIGMAGIIFMIGMMNGFVVNMIENSVHLETGALQVHHRGYHDDPSVEKLIRNPSEVSDRVTALPRVNGVSLRIKSFGLVSTRRDSLGAMLVGIDPSSESVVTNLYKSVIAGSYGSIRSGNTVLLGKTLAQNLQVRLGDEIIILSQGADGSMGNDIYKVGGIFETASPDIDRMYIYMGLSDASELLSTYGGVNEIAVSLKDADAADSAKNAVINALGDEDELEVLTWKEVLPGVAQMVVFMQGAVFLFYLIVFGVAAFGISNTLIMSIFERVHELGVMMSIGTRPSRIFLQTAVESVMMGLIGSVIGSALGFLLSLNFILNGLDVSFWAKAKSFIAFSPVIYYRLVPWDFVLGIFFVVLVTALSSVYPALKASRLKPADAIRYV